MGVEFINTFLYVEIDLFALIILFFLLTTGSKTFHQEEQKLYHQSVLTLIIVLAFDAVTWAVDGKNFSGGREINIIFETLYWMATLLPCYYGYLYCYEKVHEKKPSDRYRLFFYLPILAGQIFLICNLFTGSVFYVSKENVYARGPWYLPVGILPFVYIVMAVFIVLRKSYRVHAYEKRQFYMLAIYMGLPFLGSLIQIAVYGVPTTWICLTISMVMCYLYVQNGDFASDATTKLNNRRRFDTYAAWKTTALHGDATMYLLMIDLNFFKAINDNYGHKEGDEALARTAAVLKKATADRPAFLARVGGDEFAVILNGVNEQEVLDTIQDIHKTMQEANIAAARNYQISLAIGYAGMSGKNKISFDRLFSLADQSMYEEKLRMKNGMGKTVENVL